MAGAEFVVAGIALHLGDDGIEVLAQGRLNVSRRVERERLAAKHIQVSLQGLGDKLARQRIHLRSARVTC